MIIEYKDFISRKDAKNNPHKIFIFGDNDIRTGFGGLAKELRGEPNAFGIRVKKRPYRDWDAFYTDREYTENIEKICEDITKIVEKVHETENPIIVFPKNGIGTGLASMQKRCPVTFNTMNTILYKALNIKNGEIGYD